MSSWMLVGFITAEPEWELLFFFFFFFDCPKTYGVLSQGSGPSQSLDSSCSNAGSLTYCAGLGGGSKLRPSAPKMLLLIPLATAGTPYLSILAVHAEISGPGIEPKPQP